MIEIKERSRTILKGELHIKIYDHDKLIFEGSEDNLIVNNSQTIVAGLIIGNFDSYTISKIGFGDGTTVPVSSDTDLQGDYTKKKTIDSDKNIIFGANIAEVHWNIDYNNDIGGQTFDGAIGGIWTDGDPFQIKEFGLFSTDDDLFNRIVWSGPDLIMDQGIRIEGHFAITVNTI